MRNNSRLYDLLIVITGLAALTSIPAIGIILLQVLEPIPIVDTGGPFPVANNPVKAGQFVSYTVTRCVTDPFLSYPFVYSRTEELVQDSGLGSITLLPNTTTIVRDKGCDTIPITVGPIPPQVPPGIYHLEGTVTAIGRFRLSPSTLLWQTVSFEVIDPDVPTS